MVPMTREEYERQQTVVRRVLDPQTGRNRWLNFLANSQESICNRVLFSNVTGLGMQLYKEKYSIAGFFFEFYEVFRTNYSSVKD